MCFIIRARERERDGTWLTGWKRNTIEYIYDWKRKRGAPYSHFFLSLLLYIYIYRNIFVRCCVYILLSVFFSFLFFFIRSWRHRLAAAWYPPTRWIERFFFSFSLNIKCCCCCTCITKCVRNGHPLQSKNKKRERPDHRVNVLKYGQMLL